MPVMDGLQAMEAIREAERLSGKSLGYGVMLSCAIDAACPERRRKP